MWNKRELSEHRLAIMCLGISLLPMSREFISREHSITKNLEHIKIEIKENCRYQNYRATVHPPNRLTIHLQRPYNAPCLLINALMDLFCVTERKH